MLQVGGEHFTNDVAVALRTPVNEAEKIKKKHGCALTSMVPEEDSIEVPSVGGRKPRIMARQVLGDVIQARAEEICQMVLTEIRRAGFDRSLNSGVVLTGGGAILEGMPEIAEQIFDMPVRRGTPAGIGGLVDVVASPVYSTAVGLVLCGYRNRAGRGIGGVAAGGDGDLRQGHRAPHGLVLGLLLREARMEMKARRRGVPAGPARPRARPARRRAAPPGFFTTATSRAARCAARCHREPLQADLSEMRLHDRLLGRDLGGPMTNQERRTGPDHLRRRRDARRARSRSWASAAAAATPSAA